MISPNFSAHRRGGPDLPDPSCGHRGNPEVPEHDSQGYRNPTALEEADVVVLGDSRSYGVVVTSQDAWRSVTERGLHPHLVSEGHLNSEQIQADRVQPGDFLNALEYSLPER